MVNERTDTAPLRILVIDDEANIRTTLSLLLESEGHAVVARGAIQDALEAIAERVFDLVFLDIRLGMDNGLDFLPALKAESPWAKVIVITAYASIETAVEAMRRGASDYLPKPFTPAQVRLVVERVSRLRALQQRVAGLEGAQGEAGVEIRSDNPAMRRAIELAHQVAATEATVLIRGESGTGKGVLAKAIHGWSDRADKPFSVVSCPTLSPQLLESELFGHVKGAFTGAMRDNPGRIAMSQNGTLFLDEIGDLPLNLQPKLLRFLQDRQYERVGDTTTRHADVRVISATNVELDQAVREGKFREDLLYRLNVVQIDLPPLRDRVEDLEPLAMGMLTYFSRRRPLAGFTEEAMKALKGYSWPGNVRELRNVIERAVILVRGDCVGLEHLPPSISAKGGEPRLGDPVPVDAIEAVHIRRLMATTKTVEQVAEILGIDTATLWRKRKKYGI